jgi:uncharacterized repeat protein (TIGR01451 family)
MSMYHAFALAAALSTSSIAAAQTAPVTLQSDIQIETTVVQNGVSKVVLVPAKRATPGKRLVIGNTYRNNSAAAISNFAITNPLPNGVSYIADPADRGVVSVDGGRTWGQLAALTVPVAGGTRRAAQASDVTHIRWIVPVIAPGASGRVSYHAVVR